MASPRPPVSHSAAKLRLLEPRVLLLVAAAAAIAALNLYAISVLLDSNQAGVAPDFQQYAGALERFLDGEPLYIDESKWRYSPAAILTLAPGIWLGLLGWTLLHILAVALIRPWWLATVFALSWPYFVDVVSGNTVAFVAVAGILAVRGSARATYAYWWLTLIMPRPFQLPLAAYLAWRRPDLRRGLAVMIVANVLLVLLLGQGVEWIEYLRARGTENLSLGFNIHPFAELGLAWLVIGVPAAGVLTYLGYPGIAGVIVFPSLLAQYLLIAFADVGSAARRALHDRPSLRGRE